MPELVPFDKSIIEQIRLGNESSFEYIFKLYYTPLLSYARLLLKSQEIAEEIVNDTFLKLWENHQAFQITYSLRSYLYRCVHNDCINYLKNAEVNRKHTQQMIDEMSYHQELIISNFSENHLDKMVSEEMEMQLNTAINGLPEQCRIIFCLSRYEQLSYQEIASKLNISINTVKTQISRALEKLRVIVNKS